MAYSKTAILTVRLFLFFIIVFLSSCASKEDVLYFQDVEQLGEVSGDTQKLVLKENDLLSIIVSAESREVAEPFNLPAISTQALNQNGLPIRQTQAYLIDLDGEVEIPKIGAVKIAGLTKSEATELIKSKLKAYIKTPIVNMRLLNFQVTVVGDVMRPGTFPVPSERISIIEAIGLAGDMAITGNRKNVLLIREDGDGSKTFAKLDFTDRDIFNSPYYYLKQNDVVVVDPNYTKIQRSISNPNIGIFLSAASLLLSILVIILR